MSNGAMTRDGDAYGLGRKLRRAWIAPLALGVLSIVAGLVILATDWTVSELALFAGVLFIFRGVGLAMNAVEARRTSLLQIVAGAAGVLAGIWLLVWPGPSLLVLALFIGAWITASGVLNIAAAVASRHVVRHWGIVLAIGVVEVLLGIWAMRRPDFSLTLAVVTLGFWAIITGVLYCVVAVELRRLFSSVDDAFIADAVFGLPYGPPVVRAAAADIETPVDMVARLHQAGLLSDEELALLLSGLVRVSSTGGR
jgi:uncharacterized membrane protein HdeD (DUF308 family)